MPKISRYENVTETKQKYEFPTYSKEELQSLLNLLKEKYNNGKTNVDIDNWMKDEGALSRYGAVMITGYEYKQNKIGESYPVCDYPTKYELLHDKLRKAYKLK